MKIAIISGSHRNNSQSEKVAKYIESELKSALGASTWLFSLANNPLPLWDEGVWSAKAPWNTVWAPIAKELQSADGLVIVSPEWAGMVPPGLKNFLMLCTPNEVGHKPALAVTVSSGIGGSYPIAELRTSGYKNNKLCFMPEHLIIRSVENMLVGPVSEATDQRDKEIRARISYSLKLLVEYSKAFVGIRESGVIDNKTYPFGM